MSGELYVYSIVDSRRGLAIAGRGMAGGALRLVAWHEIGAVVSTGGSFPLRYEAEHVLHHEHVLELLMKGHSVLPCRFDLRLRDEEEVLALLQGKYAAFRANLRRVEDMQEWCVRALWDPEELNAWEELSPHGSSERINVDVSDSPAGGATYLLQKCQAWRREALLHDFAETLIESVHEPLQRHAQESLTRKCLSERLILAAAYLVPRRQAAEFVACFRRQRLAFAHLQFLLSGPWPPSSFIDEELRGPLLVT